MKKNVGKKIRLDIALVEKGLVESREKAQALIMAGQVLINDELKEKCGEKIPVESEIRIRGQKDRYVSRAAYKILKAFEEFPLNVANKICLDIGASTGGFTQVLLEKGAKKVIALDVGTNQLHWTLRNHPQVVCLEQTNIRTYEKSPHDDLSIEFICIDASFISLRLILPKAFELLEIHGELIALIKPQHEVGKDQVGKGGIVRDARLHELVQHEIECFSQEVGFEVLGRIPSPILGSTGNREFLIYLKKTYESPVSDII